MTIKTNLRMSPVFGGCALVVFAFGAMAQNPGFYIKGDLGGNITQDIDVKEFLGANVSGVKLKVDPGIRVGVAGGYRFNGWFALEAETGFMGNEINGVDGASSSVDDTTFMNVPFLVNAKLQLPMGRCPVTPYAGAGIGCSLAIFDSDHLRINNISIEGNDVSTVFAWQAFAGLRYAMNERMGLAVEYRYFEAENPSWEADLSFNSGSDTFKLGKTHTHAISIAFDYHF